MKEISYQSAGGVVYYEGSVLLLDRPGRCEMRLPKGHIEKGETPADAALREVREETGYVHPIIVADLGTQQVEFVDPYRGWQVRREEHYFLMFLSDTQQMERTVHEEQFVPTWVPEDEASTRLTFCAEQLALRRAIRWLEKAREPGR